MRRLACRIRRFVTAAAALGAALLGPSPPAHGQTAAEPLTSTTQLVTSATQQFLVDEGVTRVLLDLRQAESSGSYVIVTPTGHSLAAATTVETIVPKSNLTGSDPLGSYGEVTAWTPPMAGEYSINASEDTLGLVILQGGAILKFWIDELAADRIVAPGRALRLVSSLAGGSGQPITAASVTLGIELTAHADGAVPASPFKTSFTLGATETPGTYAASLAEGLAISGTYTFSLEARAGNVMRHLVTSIAVLGPGDLASQQDIAPAAPLATVHITDVAYDTEEVQAAASTDGAAESIATAGRIVYYPEDRANPDKPVIVYVHGFASGPDVWYGDNGFTHPSIEANYRVAVVELHPDESYDTNAGLLSTALPQIAAYYDVKKMVVVAHSKGGVDTDAAMLFGGMTQYVKSVITLGTPHWGTPLADLADSDWIWWLAELWGRRNEAQRSMKPGRMAQFRALAAQSPHNNPAETDFRTICGWDFNSELTAYYVLSGQYLQQHGGGSGHGGNDGVVNYKDARRPGGTEIFSGEPDGRTAVNHRQVTFRNKYWKHIQAQLLTVHYDNSPSPPVGLAAAPQTDPFPGSVRLSWTDRSKNETGFRLERSTNGGPFEPLPAAIPAGFQQASDTQVQPGGRYVYRLRAHINGKWFSDYSSEAPITVPMPVIASPSGLVTSVLSPTQVRLSWTDNSSNETQFDIQRRVPGHTGFGDVLTAAANATTAQNDGLTQSTTYEYRVRARNGIFTSEWSNVASATTTTGTPAAPSGLTVTALSANSARLNWADNSTNENNFEVQRRTLPSGAFAVLVTPGHNVVTYTDQSPASMTSYEYRIRAYNSYGSSYSLPASVTMPQHASYQGCYTDSSTRALPAYLSTGGQTVESCRALGLNAGYRYAGVQYHGHCFAGNTLAYARVADGECNTPCSANGAQMCGGAWRNSVYDTGYVPPPPAAPNNMTATLLSSTSVRLTWTDNSTNETQFNVQRRPDGGAFGIVAVLGANTTSWTDSGLASSTTYEYKVRAINSAGGSAFSNTASVTTPSAIPNPPSSFSAWFDTASRTIRTSWLDNSNNETGFNVQFSYSGSAFSDMCNTPANATSCSTGPNPPSGSYALKVRAVNGPNSSTFSNVSYVTATAPPPPTASIAWIQPAEQAWGPAGTLTAAGHASNGTSGVQLVWRERSNAGVWGPWTTVAWQPSPSADTTWSNTISSGNPTNKCHWFDAYVNYSGIASGVYQYRGTTGCP